MCEHLETTYKTQFLQLSKKLFDKLILEKLPYDEVIRKHLREFNERYCEISNDSDAEILINDMKRFFKDIRNESDKRHRKDKDWYEPKPHDSEYEILKHQRSFFKQYLYSGDCRRLPNVDIPLPPNVDVSKIFSLDYALRLLPFKDLKYVCENWDTSNVKSFKGCFCWTLIDSELITNLNYSSGQDFSYMFYNTVDQCDYEFVERMDCMNGSDYSYMFNVSNYVLTGHGTFLINFEAISRMKVNLNGNFNNFFFELPRDEAEHFRRWFPDESITDIVNKLSEIV